MSYLLFILLGMGLISIAEKAGMNGIDDSLWICLAILTAGEVISWRCRK